MSPVHFIDPGNPGQRQPYPDGIGRLAHLPARYLRLAPERRQIGSDLGGGLVRQLAPRMGRDLAHLYHDPIGNQPQVVSNQLIRIYTPTEDRNVVPSFSIGPE
jgi:hypothetical protein